MEEYEEMENDAPNVPDASATTANSNRQEHELSSESGQMVQGRGVSLRRNRVNLGVLKANSGNATKRSNSRVTTSAGKSAEAVIKQFASQELQAEKGKMKEWKEKVMQEVARELHGIRQMHEGAMEAQRQTFQLELERMGGKVEQLESEVKALKFPGQQLTRETPPVAVAPSSSNGQRGEKQLEDQEGSRESQLTRPRRINASPKEGSKVDMGTTTDPPSLDTKTRIERRNYASVAAAKPAKSPEQPWTQVSYGTRKAKGKQSNPTTKQEQLGRRILSPRNPGQEKSEADLMLA